MQEIIWFYVEEIRYFLIEIYTSRPLLLSFLWKQYSADLSKLMFSLKVIRRCVMRVLIILLKDLYAS
jgi:hypothetical protein